MILIMNNPMNRIIIVIWLGIILFPSVLCAQENNPQAESLTKEKEILSHKLEALQDERDNLLKEINSLKGKLNDETSRACPSDKTSQDLMLENRSLLEQITSVRQEKISLSVQMSQLRERLQEKGMDIQKKINEVANPLQEETSELKTKIKELEDSVAEKEKMNRTLKAEKNQWLKTDCGKEVTERKSERIGVEGKTQDLEKMISDKDEFIQDLKSQNSQLTEELEEVTKEKETLAKNIADSKKEWSIKENNLEKKAVEAHEPYQEKVLALEAKLKKSDDACQDRMEQEKSRWIEDTAQEQKRRKGLSSDLDHLKKQNTDCQESVKLLESQKTVVEEKLNEALGNLKQSRNTDDKKYTNKIEALSKDLNKSQDALKQKHTELEDLSKKVKDLEKNLQKFQNDLLKSQKDLNSKEIAFSKRISDKDKEALIHLKIKENQWEQEKSKLQKELEESKKKNVQATSAHDNEQQLQKQLASLNRDLKEKLKNIQDLIKENKKLTAQLNESKARLIDEKNRYNTTIADTRRKEDLYMDKVKTLEKLIEKKQNETDAINSQSLEEDLKQKSKLTASLQQSVNGLEKKLSDAQKQLESLTAQNAVLKEELHKKEKVPSR
jgi:chromosome segregation ATPase